MGSSWDRDWTCVPCFDRRVLNHWTTRKVPDCKFYKRLCKQFPMHLKMYLMEVWMSKYILQLDLMVYFQISTLYIWKLKHRDINLSLITHPESLWAWCGLHLKTQSHYVLCYILLHYSAAWISTSQDAGAVTFYPGCTEIHLGSFYRSLCLNPTSKSLDLTGLGFDSTIQGWDTASPSWGSDHAFPEVSCKYYKLLPGWNETYLYYQADRDSNITCRWAPNHCIRHSGGNVWAVDK